ncbi:MAG TPA: DUF2270 domain-containing protein [Pyrinomonadaceae bacterium]|jgi:uncharacterized membrane protein|nr:DUF2270 domain-containing protein [Pyrinomonadaceae bacterium]
MAIRTEPTQRISDTARTDSGIHDSRITTRVPLRGSQSSSLPGLSGERVTGKLRPVSTSIHDTVVPDRMPTPSIDALRKLSPAEFNTAMAHFYRGEVQRSNTWRSRLDNTTYWAVITVAGALSFAFSSPSNPHFLIPIISILVAIFLLMEARRYRYYEIWASRVRVIETGYFAQMLAPEGVPRDQEWASHLASDLLTPHFTISNWEAIGRRLRRNYIWLFALLALSWNLKTYLHPQPAANLDEFIARATVGLVPGSIVIIIGVVFNFTLFIFAITTIRLREATGEVLPRHQFSLHPLQRVSSFARAASSVPRATVRRARRARHRLRGSKTDMTQAPDRKIHVSETPDRKTRVRSQESGARKESLADTLN